MHKDRITLSAQAVAGRGGQGLNFLHMMQGYAEDFEVYTFSRGLTQGFPGKRIEPSRLLSSLGRVPLFRRNHAWLDLQNAMHFDRQVSGELQLKGGFFQGVTGQCLESLEVARKMGALTILDCVTLHARTFRNRQLDEGDKFGLAPRISKAMLQRMEAEYASSDRIRVMSHVAKADMVKQGVPAEKIVVSTPPVDCLDFPQADFSKGVFRISYVGMLEPAKGVRHLLEAYSLLSPGRDVELVFWGGFGSRRMVRFFKPYLDAHPGIRVQPGSIRTHGLDEVYGSSHVLVHPSLADGFGYVVQEAMACGLPVIVTDSAGSSDMVQDGQNGYIVPAGDTNAIVERLKFLLENPGTLSGLGACARDTVKGTNMESFRKSLLELTCR